MTAPRRPSAAASPADTPQTFAGQPTRRSFLGLTGLSATGLALAGLGLTGIGLTGCDSPPPVAEPRPDIAFRHLPPLQIDAASVDIQQPFVPSGRDPNIEHLVPVPPAHVAANWARDRLQPVGSNGVCRYTILDASMTRTSLTKERSVSGLFKAETDSRIDARVEIRIDVSNGGGTGFATAVVTRTQTMLDNLTLNEQDAMLTDFVEALGRDMNQRLETEIRANLGLFLRNAG